MSKFSANNSVNMNYTRFRCKKIMQKKTILDSCQKSIKKLPFKSKKKQYIGYYGINLYLNLDPKKGS